MLLKLTPVDFHDAMVPDRLHHILDQVFVPRGAVERLYDGWKTGCSTATKNDHDFFVLCRQRQGDRFQSGLKFREACNWIPVSSLQSKTALVTRVELLQIFYHFTAKKLF